MSASWATGVRVSAGGKDSFFSCAYTEMIEKKDGLHVLYQYIS